MLLRCVVKERNEHKSSVLDMLNLKWLLDFYKEMSKRQLDIHCLEFKKKFKNAVYVLKVFEAMGPYNIT